MAIAEKNHIVCAFLFRSGQARFRSQALLLNLSGLVGIQRVAKLSLCGYPNYVWTHHDKEIMAVYNRTPGVADAVEARFQNELDYILRQP